MRKAQIELVEPKGLTIYLPSVGPPVAVRGEGDEVVILMRLTLRPRDNVVMFNFDVAAGGNGAAVLRIDEDARRLMSAGIGGRRSPESSMAPC